MKVKLLKKLRKKARERIFIVEYCDALKERTGYDYVIHYPTFYGNGFIRELREDSAYLICKVRRRNFILDEIDSKKKKRNKKRKEQAERRRRREWEKNEREHEKLLKKSKKLDY